MGLNLVIDANVDDYSVTTGKFDGFKVMDFEKNLAQTNLQFKMCFVIIFLTSRIQILVHAPEEFPDVADRGFVIGPGTET